MSFQENPTSEKKGGKRLSMTLGAEQPSPITGGIIFIILISAALIVFMNLGQNPANIKDWVALFVLILMLGAGAMLFTWSVRKSEQRIQHELKLAEWYTQHERELEAQRFQEIAFQTYLDRMTELLLDKKLRRSKPGDEVRDIARARTLTALRGLDGAYKSILLKFLHETDLITSNGIVSLQGANLRGADLKEANMTGIDLSGADLSGADLRQARLSGANLSQATMIVTNISEADLSSAILKGASLTEAVANGVNLSGADLSEADLHGVNLENANLAQASLTDANLNSTVMIDANLQHADLRNITLTRANLTRATLNSARLNGADLSWANLSWAKLENAIITQANLHGANLEGAEVIASNLAEVKSLKGATMPDGRKHE